jgi:spore photoproduct lyase
MCCTGSKDDVMPSSSYYTDLFRQIYVEEQLAESPYLARALAQLPGVPVHYVKNRKEIASQDLNRQTLLVSRPRGRTVTHCPGSKGALCCNYITVDLYLGCTLGCGYCIMESYLNFSPITVYLEPEHSIARLQELARDNPELTIRAGTGEVGDSLLLDPLFGLSERFIRSLSDYPNVFFELKTKTHFVDHLLDIEPKGNAVIGFSVNPQGIIEAHEPGASSLVQRLEAAGRAVDSGFRLAFHFDPIFINDGRQEEYLALASALQQFPADRIAWISLGTMRYTAALKRALGEKSFLYEEFVPCRDGKLRYPQKTRSRLYSTLYTELKNRLSAPVYLCMETPAVWSNVFGRTPGKIEGLRAIFKKVRSV